MIVSQSGRAKVDLRMPRSIKLSKARRIGSSLTQTFGLESRDILLAGDYLPLDMASRWHKAFDAAMQTDMHARVKRTVTDIAAAWGATAAVTITAGTPVLVNDPALTARMQPSLERYARRAVADVPWTPSEDFAFFDSREFVERMVE